ncbi:uncharacterized protein ACMZJ9_012727 [Mantella aurantiaca]
MKVLLCLAFAVGLIAVASTLTCNVCKFRALSICFTGSSTPSTCGNCSTTSAKFGSASLFSSLGCDSSCNATTAAKDGVFSFDYSVACCNTDRCNAGNSIKVSFSLGLGMALLWLLNAV